MKSFIKITFVCICLFLLNSSYAQKTQLTWFGHSAFRIVTPQGHILWIDPWLRNQLVVKETKGDYILVTHGHFDHVGDSVDLAKFSKAKLVANFELATNMVRLLGFPSDQMGFDTLGNSGGRLQIADGEVTVFFTPAVHSSSLDSSSDKNKNAPLVYAGNPNGFVIHIKNGPSIYHTGDTAYFKDMELLANEHIDVGLINIGGHFGMEPAEAVNAAKAIKAKLIIPHHFGTFPVLTQKPDDFIAALTKAKIKGLAMTSGQTLEFEGRKQRP